MRAITVAVSALAATLSLSAAVAHDEPPRDDHSNIIRMHVRYRGPESGRSLPNSYADHGVGGRGSAVWDRNFSRPTHEIAWQRAQKARTKLQKIEGKIDAAPDERTRDRHNGRYWNTLYDEMGAVDATYARHDPAWEKARKKRGGDLVDANGRTVWQKPRNRKECLEHMAMVPFALCCAFPGSGIGAHASSLRAAAALS